MAGAHPNRTFKVLMGAGITSALLLGMGFYRVLLAACPDLWSASGFVCVLQPTRHDLGTHLLLYGFLVTILSGTLLWMVVWRRQRTKGASLSRDLTLLQASGWELQQLSSHLGVGDKIRVVDSEAPLCFCAGFIAPRIYVSQGMVGKVTPEELEALLLHEKHHLENRDPLKILAGTLVASALFFIPILRDMLRRYLVEKEIAADQSAIRYQGHRRGIAGALFKMLEERRTGVGGFVASGRDALGCRIDHLTGDGSQHMDRVPASHVAISLAIASLIIFAVLAPLPSHIL